MHVLHAWIWKDLQLKSKLVLCNHKSHLIASCSELIEELRYSTFVTSTSAALASPCNLASIAPKEKQATSFMKRMKIELDTLSSDENIEYFFMRKSQQDPKEALLQLNQLEHLFSKWEVLSSTLNQIIPFIYYIYFYQFSSLTCTSSKFIQKKNKKQNNLRRPDSNQRPSVC